MLCSSRRSRISQIACALVLAGCLASATRAEAPAPAQPPATGATEIATRWLRALKRGNVKLLAKVTRYPFRLAFQNAPCTCDDGDAQDSAQLGEITRTLMQDSEIKGQTFDPAETEEIARDQVPNWARRWKRKLPKEVKLVHAWGGGPTIYTLEYFVAIVGDQVQSVLVNARTDEGSGD